MTGALIRLVLTTVVILAMVLLVARALRKKGIGPLKGGVTVTSRFSTGKNSALLVVDVDGRRLLIGQAPGSFNTLYDMGEAPAGGAQWLDDTVDENRDDIERPAANTTTVPQFVRGMWSSFTHKREAMARARADARSPRTEPVVAVEAADTATEVATKAAVETATIIEAHEAPASEVPAELEGLVLTENVSAEVAPSAVERVTERYADVFKAVQRTTESERQAAAQRRARLVAAGTVDKPFTRAASAATAAPVGAAAPAKAVSVESLDNAQLTRVLRDLDARVVLISLKGAKVEDAQRIGECYVDGDPQRRQALVDAAGELAGTQLSREEIRSARQAIAQNARKLLAFGQLNADQNPASNLSATAADTAGDRFREVLGTVRSEL